MHEAEVQEILNGYYTISRPAFQELGKLFEEVSVEKGQNFIQKGRREFHEYLLLKGICRAYLYNSDGEEISLAFFKEGQVLSPFITRTQEGRSILHYQALSKLHLVRFSALDFAALMKQNLEIRTWGNEVLKKELLLKVEREIELISLNAKSRLLSFRKRFPGFENRIPLHYIASYLGITNVSLSRLRKDSS